MIDDPVLLRFRYADLRELAWHWSGAYSIGWELGMFRATRRDNGATVRCSSAEELHRAIQADYRAQPVPRRVSARKAGNRLGSA